MTLFRLCQEAVGLLLQDAESLQVNLSRTSTEMGLSVSAHRQTTVAKNGQLLAIQDLTKLLGGTLQVVTDPPSATLVRATLPITRPSQDDRRVPPHWA